jgi:hypothetical protein
MGLPIKYTNTLEILVNGNIRVVNLVWEEHFLLVLFVDFVGVVIGRWNSLQRYPITYLLPEDYRSN